MKGIKFDGNHSYDAYQLFLNSYSIGEAEPNTNLVEIPGVDGAVDFTEYFGGVTYKSRILKMQFTFIADRFGLNAAYAKLQNALNGKRVKIVLDDDKDYFYTGRVSVGELSPDGQIGEVTLTATCDPYKYKNRLEQ
ncbi:MAG: distal tail protein Dit [Ruminococcus callidus]